MAKQTGGGRGAAVPSVLGAGAPVDEEVEERRRLVMDLLGEQTTAAEIAADLLIPEAVIEAWLAEAQDLLEAQARKPGGTPRARAQAFDAALRARFTEMVKAERGTP